MIALAALMIISIVIFICRMVAINRAGKRDETFADRIREYLREADTESAHNQCRRTDTAYSRMTDKGLARLGRPMDDIIAVMQCTRDIEIGNLKKHTGWLSAIAVISPLLGLTGALTAITTAYFTAPAALSAAALSTTIYASLITIAAGLTTGMLSYIFHAITSARIQSLKQTLNTHIRTFIDLLNEPAS